MAASIDNRVAELERANAQLRRQLDACSAELNEARDQQTATAEVLQVINSSSGDLAPVFDAMLEKAMRLCDAAFGSLLINDGERLRAAALNSVPEPLAKFLSEPLVPEPGTALARVIDERRLVHWADAAAEEGYLQRAPLAVAGVELGGVRTLVGVPLFRDRTLLGVLHLYRQEVRPFTDKQIALLQNFAAQAVIAMENARLITETREALEQQTATAEVLQVINASPGDLAPVFDAILEKAHTLCGAASGGLVEIEGEQYRAVAVHGEPRFAEYWMQQGWIHATTGALAQLRQGEPLHIPNVTVDDGRRYSEQYKRLIELSNARSLLMVPMRKDDALLGAITALRQEVRPFAEREIALLQNFAAQAVIAMENARLITETREALEQQTATAEVLQVINSSPGDLAPVFDAMLEKATELCDAPVGTLWLFDGEHINPVATRGAPERLADFLHRGPHKPNPVQQRQLRGEGTIHLADLKATTLYRGGDTLARAVADLGGIQTVLSVPLRREDRVLGLFGVYRQETRPFSDKQIALIDNFAAQAVIAMENARLLTETREALEQQTATAEVLQVINSSPGDLAPVFDAMLEKAMRLCEAALGVLWTYDGDAFHVAASRGAPPAYAEFLASAVHQPGPNTAHGRLLSGSPFEHLPDVASSEDYRLGDAFPRALVDLAGGRTILAVPLRKDEVFLGDIFIYRQEVRPFTDKQIALLQNFAVQAVIAIENTRLITETREALEQQTATAEVLGVINSSPGDLAPVFDAMLEKAVRLCEATFGGLTRVDGDRFHAVAMHNVPQVFAEAMRQPRPMLPGHAHHRLLNGEDVVQVEDVTAEDIYRSGDPSRHALADLGGARTVLWAALRKDNTLLGSFVIYRQEVRPFTDKQIALLQNFAAQAVIAIENARLLTETREALEQQTATAEVLQVINSSPGDLAPVFDAMLEKAHTLCAADNGALLTYNGERFWPVAWHGTSTQFADARSEGIDPDVAPSFGRIVRGERLDHIHDMVEFAAHVSDDATRRRLSDLIETGGIRTQLIVPLRKDDLLLGAITANRKVMRAFTDKQIALLQNFAAQAVIAMENARLLTETREALEQQTATAEVLQVINSSPGDLAPVFDAILEKAHSLCEAAHGSFGIYDGQYFRVVATRGVPEQFAAVTRQPFSPHPESPPERLLRGERLVHLPDMAAAGLTNPVARAGVDLGHIRTILFVPLRRDDKLLGYITAHREEVRPFSEKQIALLQNFAAQAVIAMENARLITETREALEQQTATAEVLQVINSSPGDLAPVFDAMLEKATRLCEAAFGIMNSYDGEQFRTAALHRVPPALAKLWSSTPPKPGPNSALTRLAHGEDVVHIEDYSEYEGYKAGEPRARALVEVGGVRTYLAVPLRKDGRLLGTIAAYRQEVRPFTDKQIALLQNFAAQAVIAMENARLLTETREALEQQTATAEVLGVINSSPGDLAPVFSTMLEKAMRLCTAAFGYLMTFDGEHFQPVAHRGLPAPFADYLLRMDQPGPSGAYARIRAGVPLVHVGDLKEGEVYRTSPLRQALVDLGGARTGLFVALRKDEALLGVFTIYRQEVRPFADKEIALLQNFAAQAVIAMENARLITETREALEQQTATAEVLQVINSSPGDLAPVFDAMLEKAMRLCRIALGALELHEGGKLRAVAVRGVTGPLADLLRQPFEPPAESPLARLLAGEQVVQITDMSELAGLRPDDPRAQAGAQYGLTTALFVPLRKDADLLGQIVAFRKEALPFSEKEIALLQNFAAQAVIAMENARLITETREALEQQTATAEVLQVINSSPGNLAPVFDAMLEKAVRLCDFAFAALWTYDGTAFYPVALHGMPAAFEAYLREHTPPAFELLHTSAGPIHFHDVMATEMPQRDPEFARVAQQLGSVRTLLLVPLRKDAGLLGAFVAYRQEVRPFSDKQIALLQNFAAQAVIAMENARLLTETREALEQQTATAEVLQVINTSPGDLAPVFDAMLEKATRLCEAASGILWTYDGSRFRAKALHGVPAKLADSMLNNPSPKPIPTASLAAIAAGQNVVRDDDLTSVECASRVVDIGGMRTGFLVALRKNEALLGAIRIFRREVRPFSEKQVALVQNFAAQAVIAMENARLITETREALEQQTATAQVLQVINSSPGDLAPVFDAMLDKATRLCEAPFGILRTWDSERFHFGAVHGDPQFCDWVRQRGPIRPDSDASLLGRITAGERVVRIADAQDDEAYRASSGFREMAAASGIRSTVTVALHKDDALLGLITVYRQEVRPFSDKQIALLQNFAAQAVIAMENARLLGELRQRTRDLQGSLEYQTATSDVLKVISQSTFDLEPVLQTVLETAIRLCGSRQGLIFRRDADGRYRLAATSGTTPEHREIEANLAIEPGPDTLVGRVVLARQPVEILDPLADPDYALKHSARAGNLRTMLGVPLLREDVPIGVFCTAREIVEPFTAKQIELVQTFADQAVIAIENARLFNELRERTAELGRSVEELKMLGEVGRAVSSTLDLRTVLSTILNASLGVTWANAGAVFRYSRAERAFRLVEAVGWDEALARSVGEMRVAESESAMGQAIAARGPVELPDLATLPSTPLRDATLAAGFQSALIVPLVGAERIFGALVLQRREVGEFPAETVRLMQTLASQSVLAIQNARLFREIADKSEQLALASEHKSQFLANMSHELRTPLNAILGYAELLVDGIYGVLPEKAQGVLERVQNNGKHLLALINDVLDLAKIEAGQLALTLEDYALAEVVRGVVTATEPLAAAKGLKFTAIVQEGLPMAHGDARRVSQVLLNLAGNAIKFTDQGEVEINASAVNGQFVLTVRDTGPGIADADQERIFGEFQQIENTDTRKKGGTGLGLAISKRMVEMQGGMISVDSTLGRGSTFRVVLPVQVEPAMEEAAE